MATPPAPPAPASPAPRPRRALANRLNDLSWKEWLLFQKSFFRLSGDEALLGDLVRFFTKERLPDGTPALVEFLALGEESIDVPGHGRRVARLRVPPEALGPMAPGPDEGGQADLLLVDARGAAPGLSALLAAPGEPAGGLLASCRARLKDGAFCVLLAREEACDGGRYPLPWALAAHARRHFWLRDEKIGLGAPGEAPTYLIVLQAREERAPRAALPGPLRLGTPAVGAQWVAPRPPPRRAAELLHPAKFPETLIGGFIEELNAPGDVVLDPMAGTGSAAVAALRAGQRAAAVELDPNWAAVARDRVATEAGLFGQGAWAVLQGDARDVASLLPADFRPVRYAATSPPYWRILHNPGMHVASEGQRARRARGLRTTYSDGEADLGNVAEYPAFVEALAAVYAGCADTMAPGSILAVVAKNVKFERIVYPLAWDLVFRLCAPGGRFAYAGTTFWVQEDVGLKPFGMGCDWVSNVLHNYCVHLRRL